MSMLAAGGRSETVDERLVLHVEDDPVNRKLMASIVKKFSLEIGLVAAATGAEGLELAHARHPGLVLLDLDLPDMSGRQVLAALRSDPSTRDVPVVIVSAQSDPETIAALLDAGAAGYVTKPFDLIDIVRVLDGTTGVEQRGSN